MLNGARLGQKLWAGVVGIACYMLNRSPSSTLVHKTSREAWNSKKTSLEHLKVFGFDSYVHIPK